MQVEPISNHEEVVVVLEGELDHHSAVTVKEELDELIMNPEVRRLVLDMAGVHFMDSSGIGVVLGRYRTLKKRGGSVGVKNVSDRVDHIFKMSGLYQVVEKL
ncbi:anti-sigma factor antagonist [Gehongia tenuis]|uniref:Anti-sigma factor antagonist n=1 Tax=Gehongia tenuis TaxID=2763655 RepID=A0A926HLS4_9FIRM|nr:anti-sigma factor antagonist [Gehongia tenuis]MBC8532397.1 anti-sigma factor antagonist [Gehongia tenuis]